MLASLAAKAVTAVTSPIKSAFAYSPAPPSPAPAPLLDAAETRLGKRSQREDSVESALTELSDDEGHVEGVAGTEEPADRAKKARLVVAEVESERQQQQLPTPSPSRSSGSSEPAAFEAAPPKRARTTRAGRADGEDEDDNPALGKDGKQYLVAGLYWSSDVPAQKRSSPASSEDVEMRESSGARTWRSVVPSRSTTLPPPIHHAVTLLSPSIDDDAPTAFRLPFDILRDFWFVDEAKNRKGKGRVGESAAAAKARREGKGGVKTTEEDIEKREKSKKPEPYRYIGKSALQVPSPPVMSERVNVAHSLSTNERPDVYVGRGPDKAPIPAICACTPPKRAGEMGCGADCINRSVAALLPSLRVCFQRKSGADLL